MQYLYIIDNDFRISTLALILVVKHTQEMQKDISFWLYITPDTTHPHPLISNCKDCHVTGNPALCLCSVLPLEPTPIFSMKAQGAKDSANN